MKKKLAIGFCALLLVAQLALDGFLLIRQKKHEEAFYVLFPAVNQIINVLSGLPPEGTGM